MKWARELVEVYKWNKANAGSKGPPRLRTWLCGSAGSGKTKTLKSVAQHVRLIFQQEDVDATVELTAYTGIAAFNIGFGAKTCCSSFSISGSSAGKRKSRATLQGTLNSSGVPSSSLSWTRSPSLELLSSRVCISDSSRSQVVTSAS